MLKSCVYCQQFMHEIAPYDDFSMTHGLCASCEATRKDLFASDAIERAHFLKETLHELFDAGRHEDFETATRIIVKATVANCRPVDILIGMIAPMLFEIGEEWNRGALSVDAEHRFTAFSERVIRLIKSRIAADGTARFVSSKATPLFLMNAPGNRHNLAVDILALWLESRGATVWIIDQRVDNAGLMRAVETERPRYLLISMALSEQRDGVAEISKAIQALPQEMRPKIIVGGDPMKAGLIKEIPAAELLSDISAFHLA